MSAAVVYPPEECARRLGGISVEMLVALLKSGGYAYTELNAKARPWGVGRQYWGMTDEQIARVIAGQARKHGGDEPEPTAPPSPPPSAASMGIPGHDGKSRLPRRPAPRRAG